MGPATVRASVFQIVVVTRTATTANTPKPVSGLDRPPAPGARYALFPNRDNTAGIFDAAINARNCQLSSRGRMPPRWVASRKS